MEKIEFQKFDYLLAALYFSYLFLFFAHIDIVIIISHVKGFLELKMSDFYDFYSLGKSENAGGAQANYMPSIYALLGLWGYIPYKFNWIPSSPIATPVILWFKAAGLIPLLIIVKYFKKILDLHPIKEQDKKLCLYILISSPFLIYCYFIFSQVDIFSLSFITCGYYYIITKKKLKGSLLFGASLTFKYFGALIFFPLLLIYEKSIPKLCLYALIFFIPWLTEFLIFRNSIGFIDTVVNFSVANKIFGPTITSIGSDKLYLYLFLYSALCVFSFYYESNSKYQTMQMANYVSLSSLIFVFMLINWHPQWLIYISPFMTLSFMYSTKKRRFLILEMALFYIFLSYVVNFFNLNTDHIMYMNGLFSYQFHSFELSVRKMLIFFPPYNKDWSFSLFSGLIFGILLLNNPYFLQRHTKTTIRHETVTIWDLRTRFLCSFLLFSVPASLCLRYPNPVVHALVLTLPLFFYLFLFLNKKNENQ